MSYNVTEKCDYSSLPNKRGSTPIYFGVKMGHIYIYIYILFYSELQFLKQNSNSKYALC